MKHTLIIVPGWMHTSREWARAQAELPEWNVHVIDLPGFGIEPLVSTEWGVPDFALFVHNKITDRLSPNRQQTIDSSKAPESRRTNSLVEAEQRPTRGLLRGELSGTGGKVVLLGHSFGGRVLAHIFGSIKEIERLPISADALILYAAPCLYRPSMKVQIKNKLARFAKKLGITRFLPESLKPYDLRQATDSGLGEIFKRSVPYSQEEELRNITIPTTLLWGAADTSVPLRIAEEMQAAIPRAHLVTLPNEGHNIHVDNSTLFFGSLRKLLAGSL